MSGKASMFILINLGTEMLFVVSQRLQAQEVGAERSSQVLDEITSSLINQQMNDDDLIQISEMKNLIDQIAQSSIMRLDQTSMDRLWDLITMVFKWQLSMSQNIQKITSRHLYELETFTTNPDTQLKLHRVQSMFDNLNLSNGQQIDLYEHIMMWLRPFDIRVSLLLRLGFQLNDGSFRSEHFNPLYTKMLDNLGENIYAVSKQFANLEKPQPTRNEKQELNDMYDQLGHKNTGNVVDGVLFKLTFDTCDSSDQVPTATKKSEVYSEINVCSTNSFDVFHVNQQPDDVSLHEELLNMLDENLK